MLEDIKKRYKEFGEWQRAPHRVKAMTAQEHDCATCSRHYVGNYCPQCGQSATIGRYSFKNAFLLFIDVWGLGNRGMFRTIRDLVLRPGYMIRDYLRGMQMAYFPPFKMFFLICALSLLIDTGLNIKGENRYELYMAKEKAYAEQQAAEAEADASLTEQKRDAQITTHQAFYTLAGKIQDHSQIVTLVSLLLFSVPLYLLFRRCPAIGDLRFSECVVAMVYISNLILICCIIPSLLCFSFAAEARFDLLSTLVAIIPIKQLSGYSYWGTIWRLIVALIPFSIIMLAIFVVVIIIIIVVATSHPGGFM